MLEIFLWQKQCDCWDWPESSTAKAYMGAEEVQRSPLAFGGAPVPSAARWSTLKADHENGLDLVRLTTTVARLS